MTKQEKIENLLEPRIKVIALWPNTAFVLGETICQPSWQQMEWCKEFPHLFQKLEWWQDRKITELPEYIEWYDPSDKRELLPTIFKVENWYSNPNTSQIAGVYVESGNRLFIQDCKPTTKPNDHE